MLSTVHNIYYASVVPLLIVDYTTLYYEVLPCVVVMISVGISTAVELTLYMYSMSASELEATTKTWGNWIPHTEKPSTNDSGDIAMWQRGSRYPKGTLVKHKGVLYQCESHHALGEPGALLPRIFNSFFSDPMTTLRQLLVFESVVLVPQLLMMLLVRRWLPVFWALFCNCVIIYQTVIVCRATDLRLKSSKKTQKEWSQR